MDAIDEACDVPAQPRQTRDNAFADGIGGIHEHDRNGLRQLPNRRDRRHRHHKDGVRLKRNELLRHRPSAWELACAEPQLKCTFLHSTHAGPAAPAGRL